MMKKKTSTILCLILLLSLLPNVFAQTTPEADETPVLYYCLVDISPSMSGKYGKSTKKRIDVVKEKLINQVKEASSKSTIILYTFSGKDSVAISGTFELNSDSERERCIERIQKDINYEREKLKDGTFLYSSIAKVIKDAETDLGNSAPNTGALVVIFSDGEGSELDKEQPPKDLSSLKRLYTVYIQIGSTVSPKTKSELEGRGVDVIKDAEDPTKLEFPIYPVLRILPDPFSAEIEVDDHVSFISESSGSISRTEIQISEDGKSRTQVIEKRRYDYTFEKPGKKVVTLTEYSAKNNTYPVSIVFNVVPKNPLKADFEIHSQDSNQIMVGETIYFENTSSGACLTSHWRFSDGDEQIFDDKTDVSKAFSIPGEHTVQLIVTDAKGRSSSSDQKITVARRPAPVADFSIPTSVVAGSEFTLVDRSQGDVKIWRWQINDKLIGAEQIQSYMFPRNYSGVARVTLQVEGETGKSDPKTKEITVEPYPEPTPGFSVPASVQVGEFFLITDSSRDSNETTFRIGGQQIDPRRYPCESGADSFNWKIEEQPQGNKEQEVVIEQICKNEGGEVSLSKSIVVYPYPVPQPDFILIPDSVGTGETFEIVDVSQNSVKTTFQVDGEELDPDRFTEGVSNMENLPVDGEEESLAPDEIIADDSNAEELQAEEEKISSVKSFKWRFDAPGMKTITQICVNQAGVQSVLSKPLEVRPYPPARIEFNGEDVETSVDKETTFQFFVAEAVKLTLDFGDDSEPVELTELPQLSNVSHTYREKGQYVVKASVWGRDDQEATTEVNVNVVPELRPPVPNFEPQVNLIKPGKAVEIYCKNKSAVSENGAYTFKFEASVNGKTYGKAGIFKEKKDWYVRFDKPCSVKITLTISCDNGDYPDVQKSRTTEITTLYPKGYWLWVIFWCGVSFFILVVIILGLIYRRPFVLNGQLWYRKKGETKWNIRGINQILRSTCQIHPNNTDKKITISVQKFKNTRTFSYQFIINKPYDVQQFDSSKPPTYANPLTLGDYEVVFHPRR